MLAYRASKQKSRLGFRRGGYDVLKGGRGLNPYIVISIAILPALPGQPGCCSAPRRATRLSWSSAERQPGGFAAVPMLSHWKQPVYLSLIQRYRTCAPECCAPLPCTGSRQKHGAG